VGEPGSSKPAKIFPTQEKNTGPVKPTEEPKIATQLAEETLEAAGKSFPCTKITTTLTYSDGRTSTLTNWCSPEIPFHVLHEGKSYGGLVKRIFGKFTMELASFGTDAVPELTIPKE
jgi:hypothetical protein